jgi:hypothetical protein
MIPDKVETEFEYSERENNHPYIDMQEAENQDHNQAAAKNDASDNRANRIPEDIADIQLIYVAKFDWDGILELECECDETEDIAGHERQDRVSSEGSIIYAETLADDHICWVTNKKNHTGGICCCEFGHEPWQGFQVCYIRVIHEEHGAREDNRIIPKYHADESKHDVKVQEELASIATAAVPHPESSSLEDSSYVEGDCHIGQGYKKNQDVVGFNAI